MGVDGVISPTDALLSAVRSGPVNIITTGSSMLPTLAADTMVTVRREPLAFGDLAAVATNRGVVIHRYAGSLRSRLLLLGDANPRFDPLLPADRVIGRVVDVGNEGPPDRRTWWLARRCVRLLPRELRHRRRGRRG